MSPQTYHNMARIKYVIRLLITLMIISPAAFSQVKDVQGPVLIDSTFNLYQTGNLFLSGQPSRNDFSTLSLKGVTLVVNVRTKEEMERFARDNFDEKEYLQDLKIKYLQAGVGGKAGYHPETIDKISEAIAASHGKVLIHCGSAVRATMIWMAWLVKNNKCSIDEAMTLGKEARFSFPFGELIGYPLTVQKAD